MLERSVYWGQTLPGDVLCYKVVGPPYVHFYVMLDRRPLSSPLPGHHGIVKDISQVTVLHLSQSLMGDLGEVISYPVDDTAPVILFHRSGNAG